MAMDADDLLIFQKRKPSSSTVTLEKPKTPPTQQPTSSEPAVIHSQLPTTSVPVAKKLKFPVQRNTAPVQEAPVSLITKNPQPVPPIAYQAPPPKPTGQEVAVASSKTPPEVMKEKEYIQQLGVRAQQEMEAEQRRKAEEEKAAAAAPQPAPSLFRKQAVDAPAPTFKAYRGSPSTTGKDNRESAAGKRCTYHQWRAAYSLCQICGRPFCYADILKSGGNFYCLEDIDSVTNRSTSRALKTTTNIFQILAGLVLINMVIYLGYYAYPSIYAMYGHIQSVGPSAFFLGIFTSSFQYFLPLANAILVVVSLISAVAVLSGSNKGYFLGVIVVILTIGIVGYEYLISNQQFLFYTSAIALIDLALLTYGRLSSASTIKEASVETTPVNWPMPERF